SAPPRNRAVSPLPRFGTSDRPPRAGGCFDCAGIPAPPRAWPSLPRQGPRRHPEAPRQGHMQTVRPLRPPCRAHEATFRHRFVRGFLAPSGKTAKHLLQFAAAIHVFKHGHVPRSRLRIGLPCLLQCCANDIQGLEECALQPVRVLCVVMNTRLPAQLCEVFQYLCPGVQLNVWRELNSRLLGRRQNAENDHGSGASKPLNWIALTLQHFQDSRESPWVIDQIEALGDKFVVFL